MSNLASFKSGYTKAWSKELWDGLIDAIQARLAPLEEQLDIQRATTDAIVRRGLTVIEELLAPQATNADEIIGEIEDQKAEAIALVAAIQALLDVYSAGGLSADLVDETASRLFLTPALKAAYDASAADIAALKAGVDPAYDTLVEIAAKLQDDDTAIAGILTALGNRLRFDSVQTLSGGEKAQAVSNLGLGAAATKALATVADIKSHTGSDVLTTDRAVDASKWQSLGNITGAVTIDASNGCRFYATLTGNVTIDVTNLKDSQPLEIVLMQDATGGRTVGWAAKFKWPSATVPSVATAANAIAVVASCEGTWDPSIIIGAGWKVM